VMTVNGKTYHSGAGATPTGSLCTYGAGEGEVTTDDCTTLGDLTQCVKPDGRHCAKASTGREFCWNPAEAGVKVSGNEGATKAPASAGINAPPKPPANGGDWEAKGTGSVSVGSGSTINNYTIQYWQSTYGPQGDGTPD